MENRTRAIITTLTTIVASAATSMMESRLDAMRHFWWQSSGSVDLDHAVLAPPWNDLCRCSINGLQKQCTTPCPRSSEAGEVPMRQQEHLALRDVVPHVAACGPHQRSSKILFVSTADSYLLQSPTRASAPPSEAQPTDRSWPAFRSGNAVRPWDRCCCAGGSRSPTRHAPG
jgi:hypothetical protein